MSWKPKMPKLSIEGAKATLHQTKEAAKKRGRLAAANVGALKGAACQAEQVRLNTKAIASIGAQLVKAFPPKDGGMFKKSVEGFQNMAASADCAAITKAIENKSMFANLKEQQGLSKLGGRSRRRRKRKKSRKKRRKSKKRKSRRRRKKSRRRRRR